ncbi:hypothetical protein D3C78_1600750 [compost metagenome]
MVLGQVQGIGIDILRVRSVHKLHYRHRQYAIIGRIYNPAVHRYGCYSWYGLDRMTYIGDPISADIGL